MLSINQGISDTTESYQLMKDLKAYKPLQFDYPKSKSGGWESNSTRFSAVTFFIQTASNALLIHASVAVASKFKLTATPWN